MNIKITIPLIAMAFATGCTIVKTATNDQSGNPIPVGTIIVAGNVINPSKVQKTIQTVAKAGTREAIRADANSRSYFQAVVAVLTANIESDLYDANQLEKALAVISVKELRDPSIAAGISVALELYAAHAGEVISGKLDKTMYLKPALIGLRDGINDGLAQ